VETEMSEGVQAQRQYETACQGIDKNLSLLGAELQEVNAKYKNNADSAKAVAEKQEILKRTYDEQAKKVAETERAYESMVRQYGETSSEAQELETQLHNERAALYDVENQLEETEQGHNGLASAMGNLGGIMAKGIAAIGTAAAAIGTAVVAGLGYAVSQADEAKGALNDFCAATGTATEDAGQYKQVMENIYNANFGEGFEDIAAAMAEVRQQAGDLGADELEKMTTNALALRDTFDFDVAESTRAATQLMQKFGLSSDEAYNLIAQGAQNGLNKNGDLLDVINEYSNQYSQAGLSAEDMFNSIANGAATGVWSIDKMGDAFKEFSIRMNDGTANEYLTSLGLNADEVVGKFQKGGDSAKEAMSQVSEALKNCDDKTLQYTAGVGLMGTMWEDMGADACTSLMDVEGQISKTTDAMGKINAVKYDTFGEAMQGAGRILQTSFIMPIGEQALPIFSQFANELAQGAAEAGGDMGKLAQSFGDALGNMVNGLAEMLPQITSFAVELVSGLVDGIVESAPAIVQAGVSMITGLVSGIVEAIPTLTESATEIITTLINGIVELIPSLAEGAVQIIAGLAKGLGEALPELIPSVIDAVLTIVDTLINNVPMLIDAALQLVTGLANGIVAALPVIIEKLPQIITSIVNALVEGIPLIIASAGDIMTAIIDGIITAVPLLIEAMPEIITAIVNGLITGIPQVLAAVGEMVLGVLEKLGELVQQIPPVIAEAVVRLAEWGVNMQTKAREVIATMINNVINLLKELPQKVRNAIVTCISKIAEWGTKMQAKAKEAIANVCTAIVNGFKDLPGKMVQIGTNVVQGIWNGINDATGWIIDKIKGFGDAVLSGLKSFFGINSPSTLMRDEVGVFLAQGIGVGFEKEMQNVRRTMQDSIPKEFDLGAGAGTDGGSRQPGSGNGSPAAGGVVVNQYIYANETSYAGQQKAAAKNFRLIARTV
ncbi:MAG: phage tail tape measure protein, partial [Roseburia sp.]|nr:phage tail tape measure protein [Roseburia sp.]